MGELPRLYETFFTVYVINYYFAVQEKSDGKVLPRQAVASILATGLGLQCMCAQFVV